jgi:flavin-binding protein dodecin
LTIDGNCSTIIHRRTILNSNHLRRKDNSMSESVYKIIELVGTSTESWEKAAATAVERAAKSLQDIRIAEVVEQDLQVENGKVTVYRTKVKVSFKYKDE